MIKQLLEVSKKNKMSMIRKKKVFRTLFIAKLVNYRVLGK